MKKSLNKRPWRVISGGQTGVDRAGLVAAMTYCIPIGGWLPKWRLAEDGVVPEDFYDMQECEGGYRERTRANVRSANATLILSDRFPLTGGTAYTAEIAAELGKPHKIVDLDADNAAGQIRDWMLSLEDSLEKELKKIILNVAGPRESVSPGIFSKAKAILIDVFGWFRNHSGGDLCAIDDDGGLIAWTDAEFIAEMEAKHAKEESKCFTISLGEEKDQNTKMKGKEQWQTKLRK